MSDAPSYYAYQEAKTGRGPAQELDLVEIDGMLVTEEGWDGNGSPVDDYPAASQRALMRARNSRAWLKAMEAGVD